MKCGYCKKFSTCKKSSGCFQVKCDDFEDASM